MSAAGVADSPSNYIDRIETDTGYQIKEIHLKKWEDGSGKPLWLFTPAEFAQLPDGIELTSVIGITRPKGICYFDQDTRGGYSAYGVYDPFESELKDLYLMFLLKDKHDSVPG